MCHVLNLLRSQVLVSTMHLRNLLQLYSFWYGLLRVGLSNPLESHWHVLCWHRFYVYFLRPLAVHHDHHVLRTLRERQGKKQQDYIAGSQTAAGINGLIIDGSNANSGS